MEEQNEIEHFGFSAERVSLERKHFIRKILNNALDAVLEKIDCPPETLQHLVQQKETVVKSIWESIDKLVKDADELDMKKFTVPKHVLLPHNFDHVKTFSEFDEEQIDHQLQEQNKMFLENSVMLASLKMENERYRNMAKLMEDEICLQQQLEECLNALNMENVYKLVDNARTYHT